MFTELKYHGDQSYQFAAGENFKAENHFDAVVGATAAAKAGLQVGEKFQAVHGSGEGGVVHKETFHVVGVLAPTSTPVDRGDLRRTCKASTISTRGGRGRARETRSRTHGNRETRKNQETRSR